MQQMEYKLVRSRRRSVAIIIGPGGTVTVRAPMRTPIAEVERFLAQKRDWIAIAITAVFLALVIAEPYIIPWHV